MLLSSSFFPRRPIAGQPQRVEAVALWSLQAISANVTAVIEYGGIPIGYMDGWEDQEVERCFFVPGRYTPEMYPQHKDAIPLGEVDAVVISEVLGTLGALASKGK